MFELAWPAALLLLPLPWLVRWLLPAAEQRSAALKVSFLNRLQRLPSQQPNTRSSRQRWPFLLIWSLLVLAAARPQMLGEPIAQPVTGRDMMLAIDLSGSMEFRDMQLGGEETDRLTLLKHLLEGFIAQRHGDRLGLILFGSQAYVQAPLTLDRDSVRHWLQESFIGLAGRETAIGDAIGLATKRLSAESAQSRVLILLTDGANTSGRVSPIQAARLAASQSIRIFTIGIGSDSLQRSDLLGLISLESDPSLDLDEGTLREIALLTGGEYFRASDEQSMQAIYQRLNQLEPALRDGQPIRQRQPLYPWPLAVALLASLLIALRSTPGRSHVA